MRDNMPMQEINSDSSIGGAPASYEDAIKELDRLVMAMESGDVPLDQMLARYQRGAELLQYCRTQLESVENQVKILENGQLQPWLADNA